MLAKSQWFEFSEWASTHKPSETDKAVAGFAKIVENSLHDGHLYLGFRVPCTLVDMSYEGNLAGIIKSVMRVEWHGQEPGAVKAEVEKNIQFQDYLVVLKKKVYD